MGNDRQHDPMDDYHAVVDTVGLLPSLRGKDYLIQGGLGLIGTAAGAVVGWLTLPGVMETPAGWAAGIGAGLGLIAGVFLGGLVLMVMGWVRTFRKK